MEAKGFKIVLNHGDVMTVPAVIDDKRFIEQQSAVSSDGVQNLNLTQFGKTQRHLNKLIGRIDYDNKVLKAEIEKAALR